METPKPPAIDPARQRMMKILWAALALWILLLAVGASLYAPAPGDRENITVDWRRGLMVVGFVGSFLALWIGLARRRFKK